jgi:uncharacterized protein (DUF427 family)
MKKIIPKAGQESVWDYPRPPKLETTRKTLRIEAFGQIVAHTNRGFRILETSHPPTYYFPIDDVNLDLLVPVANKRSFCEFKGVATYWNFQFGEHFIPNVAWSYPQPSSDYSLLTGCLAFYPSKLDACYVDDEKVTAQAGDFYGGWITSDIVGPFKGESGTWGW